MRFSHVYKGHGWNCIHFSHLLIEVACCMCSPHVYKGLDRGLHALRGSLEAPKLDQPKSLKNAVGSLGTGFGDFPRRNRSVSSNFKMAYQNLQSNRSTNWNKIIESNRWDAFGMRLGMRLGSILVPFWGHFGVNFWVILGSFLGSILGPLWGHFGVNFGVHFWSL